MRHNFNENKHLKCILATLFTLLLCSLCIFMFTACGLFGGDDEVTVTYYVDEQEYLDSAIDGYFSLNRIPQKNHCTFLGLFDAQDGGSKIVDENGRCNILIETPITLWAQWSGNNCKITFVPGEGSLTEDLQTMNVVYGSNVSSMPIPEYEGYDFVGWSNGQQLVSSQGSVLEDKVTLNDNNYAFVTDTDEVVLTAQYERKKCTIVFDFNDGSYQTESIKLHYGETLGDTILPQRDTGSKFIEGWSTESNRLITLEGIITEDVTLYAIWCKYKEFSFYTSDTDYTTIKVLEGNEYELPKIEREAYELEGWYTSSAYFGNPIEKIVYELSATAYYAKWVKLYADDIYISNRAELEAIKDNPSGQYRLIADIDLSDSDWTPIPTFSGTLNGNGHRIIGLTRTSRFFAAENYGLFGVINSATILSVSLGINITYGSGSDRLNQDDGRIYIGGFAGIAKGFSSIKNCTVNGTIQQLYTTQSAFLVLGGFVGKATENTLLESCTNNALVYGQALFVRCGGIAGRVDDATVIVRSCHNFGYIRAGGAGRNGNGYAGGIIGACFKTATVELCSNTSSNILSSGKINSHGQIVGRTFTDKSGQEFSGGK